MGCLASELAALFRPRRCYSNGRQRIRRPRKSHISHGFQETTDLSSSSSCGRRGFRASRQELSIRLPKPSLGRVGKEWGLRIMAARAAGLAADQSAAAAWDRRMAACTDGT
jgi:hypothetical protein